jgi:hypothetical protein
MTVEGPSPCTSFSAVFEDDGETGYFYGLDASRKENLILDALHVYNVGGLKDRDKPSRLEIVWSLDGLRVILYINEYPHAAFDFVKRRGYCRTGFPSSTSEYSLDGHEWSDEVLEHFK